MIWEVFGIQEGRRRYLAGDGERQHTPSQHTLSTPSQRTLSTQLLNTLSTPHHLFCQYIIHPINTISQYSPPSSSFSNHYPLSGASTPTAYTKQYITPSINTPSTCPIPPPLIFNQPLLPLSSFSINHDPPVVPVPLPPTPRTLLATHHPHHHH